MISKSDAARYLDNFEFEPKREVANELGQRLANTALTLYDAIAVLEEASKYQRQERDKLIEQNEALKLSEQTLSELLDIYREDEKKLKDQLDTQTAFTKELSAEKLELAIKHKFLKDKLKIAVEALGDVAYVKSWTINNNPHELVKGAIKALKSINQKRKE